MPPAKHFQDDSASGQVKNVIRPATKAGSSPGLRPDSDAQRVRERLKESANSRLKKAAAMLATAKKKLGLLSVRAITPSKSPPERSVDWAPSRAEFDLVWAALQPPGCTHLLIKEIGTLRGS